MAGIPAFASRLIRALTARVGRLHAGILLLLCVLALAALGISPRFSSWAWVELFGLGLFGVALLPALGRTRRRLAVAAGLLLAATIALRLWTVGAGPVRVVTLPGG